MTGFETKMLEKFFRIENTGYKVQDLSLIIFYI